MFKSIIENGTLTLMSVSICILASIILGIIIAFVHTKTSTYSKNFIVTLIIMPMLVSVVMMMVNGNLGTGIAVAGAFSLVRFRSIPGNSKEIASVFFAMAIGLAIGMGQIFFAFIITIVISLLMLIIHHSSFGNTNQTERILKIVIPEDLDYENVLTDVLKKYTNNYTLLKLETINMGSLFELKYEVSLKDPSKMQAFINDLRVYNGNLKINLSQAMLEEAL